MTLCTPPCTHQDYCIHFGCPFARAPQSFADKHGGPPIDLEVRIGAAGKGPRISMRAQQARPSRSGCSADLIQSMLMHHDDRTASFVRIGSATGSVSSASAPAVGFIPGANMGRTIAVTTYNDQMIIPARAGASAGANPRTLNQSSGVGPGIHQPRSNQGRARDRATCPAGSRNIFRSQVTDDTLRGHSAIVKFNFRASHIDITRSSMTVGSFTGTGGRKPAPQFISASAETRGGVEGHAVSAALIFGSSNRRQTPAQGRVVLADARLRSAAGVDPGPRDYSPLVSFEVAA